MTAKPPLWSHQREAFERSKDMPTFALLFEQRCGKSRVLIETTNHLYAAGMIDALVIVAPNGVHRNWVTDELPRWATFPYRPLLWRSAKASTRAFRDEAERVIATRDALAVLALNIEAVISDTAKVYLKRFLTSRRALIACDESDMIATPGAKHTKTMLAAARYAPYRRILTGTPSAEGPLDLYAQFKFLSPDILGFGSFLAFKARYAEYEDGYDPRTGRRYPKLKGYLHLDELQAKIAPYSMRVTRAEVSDAPPKIYVKRYFALSPRQRAVYDNLRERYIAELSDGETITAANVLARYTRLQQIASNIGVPDNTAVPCPRCRPDDPDNDCPACEGLGLVEPPERTQPVDPASNPRLEVFLEEIRHDRPTASIVWARFDRDIDAILEALRGIGRKPVRYDGLVSPEERAANLADFRESRATDIVGKTSAGGRGLELSRAEIIYNYSNQFSLRLRLQGEDRAESVVKKFATTIIDFVAENTVDEKIVEALRAKRSVSDQITGDSPEAWI